VPKGVAYNRLEMLGNHWLYIVVLLVIVLIIFGPGRLPELGAGLGKAMREFRKATSELTNEVKTTVESTAPSTTSSASPSPQPPAKVDTAQGSDPKAPSSNS
jgi:sec-independent protein translocase protein TatA